jgi:DNA mismatch repair ATPase MutS
MQLESGGLPDDFYSLPATRYSLLSAMASEKQTPMMQQYWEVRNTLPVNTLLLFRLGDFYEMFFEDAEEGSRLLGITLTKRQDYPMAGIPYHALDAYVGKLLGAGRKVAICDQAEPATSGKLVKRVLTRILSPGPSSTTSAPSGAMKRPSEVPPAVLATGVSPHSSRTVALTALRSGPSAVRKGSPETSQSIA